MLDSVRLLGFGDGGWAVALLSAAFVTLLLSVAGFMVGSVIGALAAAARVSGSRSLGLLADAYSTVFRGVPDLLTIYLLYFGGSMALTAVGHWFGAQGFLGLPAFATGTTAIGIISGAYQAEVFRGAYIAIDRGQIEAARAYGMPPALMLRRVIAPQLMRHAIPGLGNVWQLVLKDSALISVIGLVELMRQAQIGAGSTREPFLFYMAAAALYLAIASATGLLFKRAERRALRGIRGV
ncbi:ABC transporter permease [Mesorhizobium sp. LSJC285A00]|uniref:ABC transporter permease n=1 Tax=unclassified Mesorhizobium TaxID=325217 RepID=UPI0003CF2D61|nr:MULTISPECIES: ABC transporter permease subunit [unclassified Mesorhizobium]ESW84229.1 ABC transporter permease [Mesorhizobium sp. LSJC285A00]ESX41083.1 ABC transporter permease [Mesorhizobium sp. LSHC426A00]ESX45651.1 ABC transporter permease [Mesorhizobium sp. LSHC424B00]ESX64573.1 ABC transporter permease [Mesorhizobium sp. LSHC416B00]ESZ02697.1 ABC transporter permease [Mesorhizobium sp. L2C089B000]